MSIGALREILQRELKTSFVEYIQEIGDIILWRVAKIRERDKDHIFTIVIVHRNAAYIIFQVKDNSYDLLQTQIEKQKCSTLLGDKLYCV